MAVMVGAMMMFAPWRRVRVVNRPCDQSPGATLMQPNDLADGAQTMEELSQIAEGQSIL
jgi:hypothetical protein